MGQHCVAMMSYSGHSQEKLLATSFKKSELQPLYEHHRIHQTSSPNRRGIGECVGIHLTVEKHGGLYFMIVKASV